MNAPANKHDVKPDTNKLYMYFQVVLAIILVNVLLGSIFLIITLYVDSLKEQNTESTIHNYNATEELDSSDKYKLNIISRKEWLAVPPNGSLDKLLLPVHRIVIAHTDTENCSSQDTCAYSTRLIQDFHMKSANFSDITYNFLVGGDGNVYEGRGWDQLGFHTEGQIADSVSIAFIGTFTTVAPPEEQINAAKLLVQEGVRLSKIAKDYRIYGTRPLVGYGTPIHEIIKKWRD